MATLVNVRCDRCPNTTEFDPKQVKSFKYLVDDDGVSRSDEALITDGQLAGRPLRPERRTIVLPADWGVLELNVGHSKEVQELCPACVTLNRSFMHNHDRQLPEASAEDTELKQ